MYAGNAVHQFLTWPSSVPPICFDVVICAHTLSENSMTSVATSRCPVRFSTCSIEMSQLWSGGCQGQSVENGTYFVNWQCRQSKQTVAELVHPLVAFNILQCQAKTVIETAYLHLCEEAS